VEGLKVKTMKAIGAEYIELNVSDLLSGIYLIRISDKDGKYLNKIVVIE
jgi:hypothetical protein